LARNLASSAPQAEAQKPLKPAGEMAAENDEGFREIKRTRVIPKM